MTALPDQTNYRTDDKASEDKLTDPGRVVDGLLFGDVECDVQFVSVVRPRDEHQVTALLPDDVAATAF